MSPMLVDPFQRAHYRRRSASLNSYRGTVKHATGLDATRVFNQVLQMTERFDSGFVGQACPGATGVLMHQLMLVLSLQGPANLGSARRLVKVGEHSQDKDCTSRAFRIFCESLVCAHESSNVLPSTREKHKISILILICCVLIYLSYPRARRAVYTGYAHIIIYIFQFMATITVHITEGRSRVVVVCTWVLNSAGRNGTQRQDRLVRNCRPRSQEPIVPQSDRCSCPPPYA